MEENVFLYPSNPSKAMKAILTLLTASLLLFGCQKEEQPFSEQMVGTWQLTEVEDLTYPGSPSAYSVADPGSYIEFTGAQFSKYRMGHKIDSGTYRIIETSKLEPIGYHHEILFNNEPDRDFYETFARIVNGRLELMITAREALVEKHTKVRW